MQPFGGFPLPQPLPTTLPICMDLSPQSPSRQRCGEGGTYRPVNGYQGRQRDPPGGRTRSPFISGPVDLFGARRPVDRPNILSGQEVAAISEPIEHPSDSDRTAIEGASF